MKDVNKPFIKLINQKGRPYVANKLGHKTTDSVSRWLKDGKVPDGKYLTVYKLLIDEGLLK